MYTNTCTDTGIYNYIQICACKCMHMYMYIAPQYLNYCFRLFYVYVHLAYTYRHVPSACLLLTEVRRSCQILCNSGYRWL